VIAVHDADTDGDNYDYNSGHDDEALHGEAHERLPKGGPTPYAKFSVLFRENMRAVRSCRVVCLIVVALFVAACTRGTAVSTTTAPVSSVSGKFEMCGGAVGRCALVSGLVTLTSRGETYSTRTDAGGKWSFEVRPGSYVLTGHTRGGGAARRSVVLTAGEVVTGLNLTIPIP
jgi:hypothetical protein